MLRSRTLSQNRCRSWQAAGRERIAARFPGKQIPGSKVVKKQPTVAKVRFYWMFRAS